MESTIRVLVVDDEEGVRDILSTRLTHWGYRCRTAADVEEAESLLESFDPDLVLSDVRMPQVTGFDLLRRLTADGRRGLPVILMTAHGTIDDAVEAMKYGAEDFLTKPLDDHKLRAVLRSVVADLERARSLRALERSLASESRVPGLIGRTEPMRALCRLVELVASSDASALITGESGTGKEVVARAIHEMSGRRGKPFVALNAAAIPEGLIESELFGHERGAFTGAVRARAGCFEQADGGTLFLDEVAEMPVALQPKLLRILEGGRARRLGGERELAFDVRVIAATNRSAQAAVADGLLREDLFYRLNVFELNVPPLRDRVDDIPLLAQHFAREFGEKHGRDVDGLRESAVECLQRYRWPGNVRELRNVLERAVIVTRQRWLEPSHFPAYIQDPEPVAEPSLVLPMGTSAAEAERQLILKTLEHVGNNKAEAARRLGLDAKTIRNRLRAFERERHS
jgi:DNA-binding NtrC family response regulator